MEEKGALIEVELILSGFHFVADGLYTLINGCSFFPPRMMMIILFQESCDVVSRNQWPCHLTPALKILQPVQQQSSFFCHYSSVACSYLLPPPRRLYFLLYNSVHLFVSFVIRITQKYRTDETRAKKEPIEFCCRSKLSGRSRTFFNMRLLTFSWIPQKIGHI